LQLDLAAERAAKEPTFSRFIWLRSGLQPSEDTQREIVNSLVKGNSLLPKDELVQSGLENFKEVLRDELSTHADNRRSLVRLYLICEPTDETDALTLRPALVNAGFEVELPEFGQNGVISSDDHERCLRSCDVILLYWGGRNEGSIRKRLEEIVAAVSALRQGRPYIARALYLGPPATPRKTMFASHLVDVILHGLDELSGLRSFATGTRAAGAQP
jgi:hypothetical protein